jgi:hypothetical protein
VPIIGVVFVLASPLRYAWQRLMQRRESQDPIF